MWFQKPPLGTPLDWGNPLNDETVLALAMNEGMGDVVQDLSMNGNHKTISAAFPSTSTSGWNPGQTGIELRFDGNDYINCGNNAILNVRKAITISAIINSSVAQSGVGRYIIGKEDAYLFIFDHSDAAYRGTLAVKTGGVWKKAGGTPIPHDGYHPIVGTYDGTYIDLYVDGTVKSSANVGGFDIDVNTESVFVGTQRLVAGGFFMGAIDQPRIQSRAWSAKEVRDYAINPWSVYLDE